MAGTSLGAIGFVLLVVTVTIAILYIQKLRKNKGEYQPRATELIDTTTTASTDNEMFQFNNCRAPIKTIERLI